MNLGIKLIVGPSVCSVLIFALTACSTTEKPSSTLEYKSSIVSVQNVTPRSKLKWRKLTGSPDGYIGGETQSGILIKVALNNSTSCNLDLAIENNTDSIAQVVWDQSSVTTTGVNTDRIVTRNSLLAATNDFPTSVATTTIAPSNRFSDIIFPVNKVASAARELSMARQSLAAVLEANNALATGERVNYYNVDRVRVEPNETVSFFSLFPCKGSDLERWAGATRESYYQTYPEMRPIPTGPSNGRNSSTEFFATKEKQQAVKEANGRIAPSYEEWSRGIARKLIPGTPVSLLLALKVNGQDEFVQLKFKLDDFTEKEPILPPKPQVKAKSCKTGKCG